MEVLNKSCTLPIEITRDWVLGFFVVELEHLKFQNETTKQIKKAKKKKQKKKFYHGRKKRQLGGFLIAMTSPMQIETLLTKQPKLHQE